MPEPSVQAFPATPVRGSRTPLAALCLAAMALVVGVALAVGVSALACGPRLAHCGSPILVLGALLSFALGVPGRGTGAMFVIALTGCLAAIDLAAHLALEGGLHQAERQLVLDLARLLALSFLLLNAEQWTLGLYRSFLGREDGGRV